MMQALILKKQHSLTIADIEFYEKLRETDVRIKIDTCGICGSDVHYYNEGRIGNFVVEKPMVLGHEASGTVVEVGSSVHNIAVGDRVCMEPGLPDFSSREVLMGMYNLDPAVRFWATPPIHGCLRETVVHPANFVFKLPDNVSFEEGALVEPMAIGFYAVQRSQMLLGSTALIIGAGTIGIATAIAAKAAGFSQVFIADLKDQKLGFVTNNYDGITPIKLSEQSILEFFSHKNIPGVHVVFEASGSADAYNQISDLLLKRGKLILLGMPNKKVLLDIVSLQIKEVSIDSIFRYVNIFPKVISMISSYAIQISPLLTKLYPFSKSIEAFEYAATNPPSEVKIAIKME